MRQESVQRHAVPRASTAGVMSRPDRPASLRRFQDGISKNLHFNTFLYILIHFNTLYYILLPFIGSIAPLKSMPSSPGSRILRRRFRSGPLLGLRRVVAASTFGKASTTHPARLSAEATRT
jgi:hypothetical protein